MKKRIKYLTLIFVMLMGIYPIYQLTRTIVVDGFRYYPELKWQFVVELGLMWTLYLSIVPVFLKMTAPNLYRLRQLASNQPKMNTEKSPTNIKQGESGKEDFIRVEFIN